MFVMRLNNMVNCAIKGKNTTQNVVFYHDRLYFYSLVAHKALLGKNNFIGIPKKMRFKSIDKSERKTEESTHNY